MTHNNVLKKRVALQNNKLHPIVKRVTSTSLTNRHDDKIDNYMVKNILFRKMIIVDNVHLDNTTEDQQLLYTNRFIYIVLKKKKQFMEMIYSPIYKLNFIDIDTINNINEFSYVIIKDENIPYVNKIIKFCEITNLPVKIQLKCSKNVDKLKYVLTKKNIKHMV